MWAAAGVAPLGAAAEPRWRPSVEEPRCGHHRPLPVAGKPVPPPPPQVRLLARSLDEYLHRALAEEEQQGGAGAVVAAAGPEGEALYEAGAFGRSGLPTMDAYLTRKARLWGAGLAGLARAPRVQRCVAAEGRGAATPLRCVPRATSLRRPPSLQAGMFPDVAERLVQAHLDKGDTMSALITGGGSQGVSGQGREVRQAWAADREVPELPGSAAWPSLQACIAVCHPHDC